VLGNLEVFGKLHVIPGELELIGIGKLGVFAVLGVFGEVGEIGEIGEIAPRALRQQRPLLRRSLRRERNRKGG